MQQPVLFSAVVIYRCSVSCVLSSKCLHDWSSFTRSVSPGNISMLPIYLNWCFSYNFDIINHLTFFKSECNLLVDFEFQQTKSSLLLNDYRLIAQNWCKFQLMMVQTCHLSQSSTKKKCMVCVICTASNACASNACSI